MLKIYLQNEQAYSTNIPLSSKGKNENISDKNKNRKKNIETHSNLTEGSAGFTRLETVPKNDHIPGAFAARVTILGSVRYFRPWTTGTEKLFQRLH